MMMNAAGSARLLFDVVARKAYYTAGLFGGLFFMVVGPSPRAWRRSRRRELSIRQGALAHRAGGFAALRKTLSGSSKGDVVTALGSPLAAAIPAVGGHGGSAAVLPADSAFWVADIWYYPFDPGRQAAVAVLFQGGRVINIEFLGAL